MSAASPRPALRKTRSATRKFPATFTTRIQTARAVENSPISGLRAHRTLIRAIALVKEAAALAESRAGPDRRENRKCHCDGGEGSPGGQVGRPLPGRCLSGGRRRQLSHEQQRGHRQPRLGAAGRRARRIQARPSQRPRELRAIDATTSSRPRCGWQRCSSWRSCIRCSTAWSAALDDKGKEFHHVLKSGARTCRTRVRSASGRSSRPMPGPIGARPRTIAAAVGFCARSVSAVRRWVPASTPILTTARGGRRVGALLGTETARRGRHALRDAIQSRDVERELARCATWRWR